MAFHGLLVSSGFSSPAILEKVRNIVRDRMYTKAHIVTTARPEKEHAPWNAVTKEQLEDMGLTVSFVDFDAGESIDADTDLIYVCGGNTFHLLRSIQVSSVSIREQILALCARGGLYIGSSAGAVIASPDISSADEVHPDRNIDGVTDYSGFNFVSRHIIPHYDSSMDSAIRDFCEKYHLTADQIVLLRNGEGLYVDGDKETLLSLTKHII